MDNVEKTIDGIQDTVDWVEKSFKKRGFWKTIRLQLVAKWPYFLVSIIGFGSLFFYQSYGFGNIEQKLSVNVQQNCNGQVTSDVEETPKKAVIGQKTETDISFKAEDWIIDRLYSDKEGYYCSNVDPNDFEYWSIWSKKKYPVNINSLKITFKLKKNYEKASNSVVFSYGEYVPNFSPQSYYRLVLFDNGPKAIRLYDDKNVGKVQDYLDNEPVFTNPIALNLSPRTSGPESRALMLNPSITYTVGNSIKSQTWNPKKDFQTIVPSIDLEDNIIQQQVGIGIKQGTCIKIISAN